VSAAGRVALILPIARNAPFVIGVHSRTKRLCWSVFSSRKSLIADAFITTAETSERHSSGKTIECGLSRFSAALPLAAA
jgi:hypothetical protein